MIDEGPGPLAIGSSFLDKYEVQALIGRGGHAWVYQGVDNFMGRHVAIKIVVRGGASSRDTVRRARAEAQFLSRFEHPNVVEVFDGGLTKDEKLYIVMELLSGRSLYDVLKHEERLEAALALPLFIQIADALHAVHEAGAIHRDLKPGNVFVIEGNRIKVLDFGIAKLEDAGWTTGDALVVGTVFYMSPEQLTGSGDLGPHTDIYSLGAMLYEALSGVQYVKQRAAERNLVVHNIAAAIPIIVHEEITPLREIAPSVPAHVASVVERCLAKAIDQRFDSMHAVAQALRASYDRLSEESAAAGRPLAERDLSGAAPASDPLPGRDSPTAALPAQSKVRPRHASADKALTPPNTVSAVASISARIEGGAQEARPRGIARVAAVAAFSGLLVSGVLAFLYFDGSRRATTVAGPASAPVVEPVISAAPADSARQSEVPSGERAAAAAPSAALTAKTPAPRSHPRKPEAAPGPSAISTASAARPKDKVEERLRMLEEDFRRDQSGAKDR